jgi:hypothetical protein
MPHDPHDDPRAQTPNDQPCNHACENTHAHSADGPSNKPREK